MKDGNITEIGDFNTDAANGVMTPAMRLQSLRSQHQALERRIAEMYEFPYQNRLLLQRLKKEKLMLKDQMERLKNDMIPDLNA